MVAKVVKAEVEFRVGRQMGDGSEISGGSRRLLHGNGIISNGRGLGFGLFDGFGGVFSWFFSMSDREEAQTGEADSPEAEE
jgi:hypothetical protein